MVFIGFKRCEKQRLLQRRPICTFEMTLIFYLILPIIQGLMFVD